MNKNAEYISDSVLTLINEFIGKLKELNQGNPIPQLWIQVISEALGKRKRGAPIKNKERDIAIAHEMLLHDIKIEKGTAYKSLNQFADDISAKYSVDTSSVFKIAKKYLNEAMVREICDRLKKSDEERRS